LPILDTHTATYSLTLSDLQLLTLILIVYMGIPW